MPYFIEPEVSGQLGENTIIDSSIHPPKVELLHFVFYGWLGDDLIECFPVFLISDNLKNGLSATSLTGLEIRECEIEESDEFKLLQNVTIPQFHWFYITGNESDDFCISDKRLKVSDKAFLVLNQYKLQNALVLNSIN